MTASGLKIRATAAFFPIAKAGWLRTGLPPCFRRYGLIVLVSRARRDRDIFRHKGRLLNRRVFFIGISHGYNMAIMRANDKTPRPSIKNWTSALKARIPSL